MKLKALGWSVTTNKAFVSLTIDDKIRLLEDLNNKRVLMTERKGKNQGSRFYDLNQFNKDSQRLLSAQGALKGMCTILCFHYKDDKVLGKFVNMVKVKKNTSRVLDLEALLVSTPSFWLIRSFMLLVVAYITVAYAGC